MKKKVLLGFSGLIVLLLAGVFGGQSYLKGRLQKESLVEKMEEAWNCRAHLDETSVSLFSAPATVKLVGLKLSPRDAEVGKPLAERAPLAPDVALVSAPEVILSLELTDLLTGTLNIERLHVEGLDVRNVVNAEGVGSLDAMFKSPHPADPVVATTGNAGGAVDPAKDPTGKLPKEKKPRGPTSVLVKASDLRVNLAVKSAGISNCRFESTDLQGSTKTVVEHLQFAFTDIDVISGDLAAHNFAKFNVSGSLHFEKTDQKLVMANCILEGSGSFKPFDPKTGEWRPDADLELKLRKGGLLGGTSMAKQIKQMKPKDQEKFAKIGLDFGDILLGGMLEQDAITKIHVLANGKLIIKEPTTLAFSQYEISMKENSWFHPPLDLHNITVTLTINPELSARIVEGAKKTLAEAPPKEDASFAELAIALVGPGLAGIVADQLMDEQKRLVLPYIAKGKMSDPKLDFSAYFETLFK